MRTTAQIVRDYRGPPLFGFGFRIFFLLAASFSAVAVPLWVTAMLAGGDGLADAITRDWHVHEMLFGYTGAVIAGYMTIAGANWTGRFPVAGRPVICLAAVWVAGRIAMVLAHPDSLPALVVDGAFLCLFAAALWREQLAARNGRNLIPAVVVTLLAGANIAFHMRGLWPGLGPSSERAALGLVALLIAVMGGRLVPSFTRNWLARRGQGPEPAPYDRLDAGGAVLVAIGLLAWQVLSTHALSGFLLVSAGLATLGRLARWRGWATRAEPLVAVLHLGYLWLAAGLALLGLSILLPASVPHASAVHALSAGAIGTMTLAMMTRTTLSHTGRARRADMATVLIHVFVGMAALTRVSAPFLIAVHLELFILSAVFWSLAFGLFALVYGPMLVAPFRRPLPRVKALASQVGGSR